MLAAAMLVPGRAPARLRDARCDGRTPSPAAEGVRVARDVRRTLGLPASRTHVTAVERSRRARRRGTALHTVALTAPEARYVRARNAVERVEGRARADLRAHALPLYGGVSTDGRFPGRPFLAVRRNQIVVEVITARRDARAFFARRYGDAVPVRVIATRPTGVACVPVDAYTPGPDGRSVVVRYVTGLESAFVRPFVAETSTTVRVGVIERVPNGPVDDVGVASWATVALAAPLGTRTVLDAETGRRLPQVP